MTTIKNGARLIAVWVGLAFLAGVVALQAYSLMIVISWMMIQSEALRPAGWSSVTISGVSRFAVLLAGMGWLGFVAFLESLLRSWDKDQLLKQRSIRLAGLLLGVAALCFLFNLMVAQIATQLSVWIEIYT